MSSGMKPPSNTINSNTTQFHYLSSAPKPPEHHHHPFPAPPPLTGKSPTSTPDTLALLATRQGRFLPSTLHFANYPGFFAQGVRITHNQQHDQGEFARNYPQYLATPQEHPLPHRHTPGMGRRHEIHFWRRRAGYDPSTRPPRSRLSSERQMLGHPPRPCHRQRTGTVH